MNEEQGTIRLRLYCNRCCAKSYHNVVFSREQLWHDIDDVLYAEGGALYRVVECGGCEEVRLVKDSWVSQSLDDDIDLLKTREIFPPAVGRRRPVWWRTRLPGSESIQALEGIVDEIYSCLSLRSFRLCVMGMRALAERMMIDKVGAHGRFQTLIAAFFAAGYVAPQQQSIFEETLIEAGHAAMHRGFSPDEAAVNVLLDVIEGLISSIYYQPLLAVELNESIPPRSFEDKS